MLQGSTVFALEGRLDIRQVVGFYGWTAADSYLTRGEGEFIVAAFKCGGILMFDVVLQVIQKILVALLITLLLADSIGNAVEAYLGLIDFFLQGTQTLFQCCCFPLFILTLLNLQKGS